MSDRTASSRGHPGLSALILLLAGCSPSPEEQAKALVESAQRADAPAVARLLDAGADVNGTYERPWPVKGRAGPALRVAAAAGDLPLARLLLDRGADPLQADALATAAEYGRTELVKLLLDRKAAAGPRSPFLLALRHAHMEIAALLAAGPLGDLVLGRVEAPRNGESPDLPGLPFFLIAVRAGRLALAAKLLDLGADVDAPGPKDGAWAGTALFQAARDGRLETATFLLDRKADPALGDGRRSPLVIAAGNGHADLIRLLAKRGVPVDGGPQPALVAAAYEGRLETVRALLDLGADVNRANINGITPLKTSAIQGHPDVVRLLLERGAVVDPGLPSAVKHDAIRRLLERR